MQLCNSENGLSPFSEAGRRLEVDDEWREMRRIRDVTREDAVAECAQRRYERFLVDRPPAP